MDKADLLLAKMYKDPKYLRKSKGLRIFRKVKNNNDRREMKKKLVLKMLKNNLKSKFKVSVGKDKLLKFKKRQN